MYGPLSPYSKVVYPTRVRKGRSRKWQGRIKIQRMWIQNNTNSYISRIKSHSQVIRGNKRSYAVRGHCHCLLLGGHSQTVPLCLFRTTKLGHPFIGDDRGKGKVQMPVATQPQSLKAQYLRAFGRLTPWQTMAFELVSPEMGQ